MSEIKTEIEQEFERAIAEIENDLTNNLSYFKKYEFKIVKIVINIDSKKFWLNVKINNNNISANSFVSHIVLNEINAYPFKHSYLFGWDIKDNNIVFLLTNTEN